MPTAIKAAGYGVDEWLAHMRSGRDYCGATDHVGERWVSVAAMSDRSAPCRACLNAAGRRQRMRRMERKERAA